MDGDLDVTSVREVIEDGKAPNRVRAVEAAGGEVLEQDRDSRRDEIRAVDGRPDRDAFGHERREILPVRVSPSGRNG